MSYTRLSRKNKLPVCAVFLVFLAAISCSKDDDPFKKHPPVTIPEECKDFFYFQQGAYWIYQDSISGNLDSLFVEQSVISKDTIYDGQDIIGIYEYFTMIVADTTGMSENHRLPPTTANFFGLFRIQRTILQNSAYINKDDYTFYPFKDTTISARFGNLSVIQTMDSLNVLGISYPNIVVFKNTADALNGQNQTIRYFAKNVGLIREEIPALGKIRQLVRKG